MADVNVELRWLGEGLQFEGGARGAPQVLIDGDGRTAPSPVQQLLLSFAACMGADIDADLQEKPLRVGVAGERAPEPPRRYVRIVMTITAGGVADADAPKLQRALDLSKQTYCSVLHTLRPDAELIFELHRH